MPNKNQQDTGQDEVAVAAGLPSDLAAIIATLDSFLDEPDDSGKKPANARCGVYAFYDYDGEPIYIGQTAERLRVRIRRHLTNQRTDAVAMSVLDPLEVAEIEIFPFWNLEKPEADESNAAFKTRVKETLGRLSTRFFKRPLRNQNLVRR